ncbi:hypothetical protein ABZ353_24165 [Streptomyces niveus]
MDAVDATRRTSAARLDQQITMSDDKQTRLLCIAEHFDMTADAAVSLSE